MQLREYQQDIFDQLTPSDSDDLVQLDTGAGKTPIEAAIAAHYPYTMLLAHRNLLITQMSEKLAAFGLVHDTISTEHTRRRCIFMHRLHGHGRHIERGHTDRLAVSIDSLLAHHRRGQLSIDTTRPWVIVIDEAHHVQPDNKWGALREIFPNARFIGMTATPGRSDGGSLHVSSGGLFERLVQAGSLRESSTATLISRGYLSDFDMFSPGAISSSRRSSDAQDLMNQNTQSRKSLTLAADPIEFYQNQTPGKRIVMFLPSIKNAEEFADLFKAAGIPSAAISSQQSPVEIARIIDAFRDGVVKVLTNVDMVSEGFDLPGIDGIFMCKTTASFIMYRQWCGRALRPCEGKDKAVIADFVGNIAEHGQPDDPVEWDIVNPPRGLGVLKQVPCSACGYWYPIRETACPKCNTGNPLLEREEIGGYYVNIRIRLDRKLVAALRGEDRLARRESILETELLLPGRRLGLGMVEKIAADLRIWCCLTLKEQGIPIRDINRFIASSDFRSVEFWTSNFTINDLEKNTKKAKRVYREWLKSN
jgi:superfamily II DNA or RNA helicase